jgi:8-oxo-dGTP pyrophosphatase MutT (NUDIX family)
MKPNTIRPIAICIVRNGESLLLFEGRDETKQETFYRPLGGSIDFGEYSIDTVRRELIEEIGVEIHNIRYLGFLENIFTYEGDPGHEIVIVYEAELSDTIFLDKPELTGYEDDGSPFRVVWKTIGFFRESSAPLYPDGLLELLEEGEKET